MTQSFVICCVSCKEDRRIERNEHIVKRINFPPCFIEKDWVAGYNRRPTIRSKVKRK